MADTMFSAREAPWTKLGKISDGVTSASHAAELGGLNFTVEQRPLTWTDDSGVSHPVYGKQALVRVDTGDCLSVMSTGYTVLQYGEAFDFMDTVNSNFIAAGVLKGGRQGFMVVDGPEMNVLNGDDPHKLYVVLRTSHDGSRAIEVSAMPLRGLCMNMLTLNTFAQGAVHRWAIRHTSSMAKKLSDAHTSLKMLDDYAVEYANVAERLALTPVTNAAAEDVLTHVLPDRPRRGEQITAIIDKWHTAETVGFDWTGWGLLNAVSEYFDWGRSHGTPESRFIGALQGQTHRVINRVTDALISA